MVRVNAPAQSVPGDDETDIAPSEAMIGRVLGHLRRAEGLSEQDLADHIGASRERIEAFEAGAARLDYETVRLIANALNFDAAQFIRALDAYHRFQTPRESR